MNPPTALKDGGRMGRVWAVRGPLIVDDVCASWDDGIKTNVLETRFPGKLWEHAVAVVSEWRNGGLQLGNS